jgi:hypothetical protein
MGVLNLTDERRASRRRPLQEVPQIVAVKIDSEAVKVIDISRGGVCLESRERLAPGNGVKLQIVSKTSTLTVRCRILRCQVKMTGGKLVYEAGAVFEKPLQLVDESLAQAVDAATADVPTETITAEADTMIVKAVAVLTADTPVSNDSSSNTDSDWW